MQRLLMARSWMWHASFTLCSDVLVVAEILQAAQRKQPRIGDVAAPPVPPLWLFSFSHERETEPNDKNRRFLQDNRQHNDERLGADKCLVVDAGTFKAPPQLSGRYVPQAENGVPPETYMEVEQHRPAHDTCWNMMRVGVGNGGGGVSGGR